MNSPLYTILTLVLFVASVAGGFVAFCYCTDRFIGFFNGARLAAYTQGDAISERKHKILLAAGEALALALGACTFILAAPWSGLVLACSLGAVIGVFVAFWMNRGRLLPAGWPRQNH